MHLPLPGDSTVRVVLFEDEEHLLVGDDSGRFARWTLSATPTRADLVGSGPGINGAVKLKDGRLVVARGEQVDILSNGPGGEVNTIIKGISGAISLASTDDGSLLAAGFGDGTIRIWSTADFTRDPILLKGHNEYVRSLAFDAQGERLVSVGDDGAVKSWTIGGDSLAKLACRVLWRDLDDLERREYFGGSVPRTPTCSKDLAQ